MELTVPKCLTSPRTCKHATTRNQKTTLFHLTAEIFFSNALKHIIFMRIL